MKLIYHKVAKFIKVVQIGSDNRVTINVSSIISYYYTASGNLKIELLPPQSSISVRESEEQLDELIRNAQW